MALSDAQRAALEENRTASGQFGSGGQDASAGTLRAALYDDPWMAAGICPDDAHRWYQAGVGLEEASRWDGEAFAPDEGLQWRAAGFAPQQATAWAEALDGENDPPTEAQAWWADPREAYASYAQRTGAPAMSPSEIEGVWANERLWSGTPESKRIRVRRDCLIAADHLAASAQTRFGQATNRDAYREMGFTEREMAYWARCRISPRNATIAACLGITPGVAVDALEIDPSLSPATARRIQIRTAVSDAHYGPAMSASSEMEGKDGMPVSQMVIENARETVVRLRENYGLEIRSAPNPYDRPFRMFTDAVVEDDYRAAGVALREAAEQIEADAVHPSRWLGRELRGQGRMVG